MTTKTKKKGPVTQEEVIKPLTLKEQARRADLYRKQDAARKEIERMVFGYGWFKELDDWLDKRKAKLNKILEMTP